MREAEADGRMTDAGDAAGEDDAEGRRSLFRALPAAIIAWSLVRLAFGAFLVQGQPLRAFVYNLLISGLLLAAGIAMPFRFRWAWWLGLGLLFLIFGYNAAVFLLNSGLMLFGHELYEDSPATYITVLFVACFTVLPAGTITFMAFLAGSRVRAALGLAPRS